MTRYPRSDIIDTYTNIIRHTQQDTKMTKTEIALQVYSDNRSMARAEVVRLIADSLETNIANASTYFAKVSSMVPAVPAEAAIVESDDEILHRISTRFNMLDKMAHGALAGTIRSMICFGAPGVGKTFGIEKMLRDQSEVEYDIIKGSCTAAGLYHALFHARKGGIVILDDCDSIFDDEQTLNLMKAALDSTDTRNISWRKMATWVDDIDEGDWVEGDKIPKTFEFKGSMILLTNIDMQARVAKASKMSAHFQALMSRSLYLDLTMKTNREILIRIKDVFMNHMAPSMGVNQYDAAEILAFVNANADRMTDLSLRLMVHVVDIFKLGGDWKEMVSITKMKLS